MSFRFRFNPFKKIKKVLYKNETMPGQGLAQKILKTDIEKRIDLARKIQATDEGCDKLANALSWLREEEAKVISNLENIRNFYVVQTLVHIYGFDMESAAEWASSSDTDKRLVDKLPELPEVNFEPGTSATDIEKLKTTFKARVEQIDALNYLIPQIEHAIRVILEAAPSLSRAEQAGEISALVRH